MLAKCKRVLGSTPTRIRQLLSYRETTLAVIRFIITTKAGRCLQERELEEETKGRDARQDMESGRLEEDDEEENREEG